MDSNRPAVFDALIPQLVSAIPSALAGQQVIAPVAILHLYYFDTCAPATYLSLRTMSVTRRDLLTAEHGDLARYYIWCCREETNDSPKPELIVPREPIDDSQRQLAEQFAEVYDLLCDDEELHMRHLRSSLHAVARDLRQFDWRSLFPVTDDFVVVPADGSASYGDDFDDISASNPASVIALLQSRGLLGEHSAWTAEP